MKENHEHDLCKDCVDLDLAGSLDLAHRFFQSISDERASPRSRSQDNESYYIRQDSFPICTFMDRLCRKNLVCPLCSFFRRMRVQPDRYKKHKLLAFPSSYIFFLRQSRMRTRRVLKQGKHDIFLAVLPHIECMDLNEYDVYWLEDDIRRSGTIHPIASGDDAAAPSAILRPLRVDQMVGFSLVLRWLTFCKEHHGDRCASPRKDKEILRGFRTINCKARPPCLEIRPFTDRFVALSYVWGSGDPEAWPRVVLDAVEVTLSLGLQYLWVDRLCIDQTNPSEKHYLISKMAWIYECAECTIVAAAGSDASYGLPGAGSTKRAAGAQPHVQISPDLHLVSSLTDPRLIIEESVWSTRGWTYQEGVLSNRRLVFTDQQVYFECRGMVVHESLDLPLSLLHEESGEKMEDFVRSGVFRGAGEASFRVIASTWGFGDNESPELLPRILRLDDHISTFAARNLTCDEDSLLAFEGISERYGSKGDLGMFLGIPVWNKGFSDHELSILHSFALGIFFWAHTDGLDFENVRPGVDAVRRKHLPSWTWAGWKGNITWRTGARVHFEVVKAWFTLPDITNGKKEFLVYSPEMTIRDSSGTFTLPISKLTAAKTPFPEERQYLLCIHQPLILDIRRLELDKATGFWKRVLFGIDMKLSAKMTAVEVIEGHETERLISVLVHANTTRDHHAFFMVLRQVTMDSGERLWQRLGNLAMDGLMTQGTKGCLLIEEVLQILPVKPFREVVVT